MDDTVVFIALFALVIVAWAAEQSGETKAKDMVRKYLEEKNFHEIEISRVWSRSARMLFEISYTDSHGMKNLNSCIVFFGFSPPKKIYWEKPL